MYSYFEQMRSVGLSSNAQPPPSPPPPPPHDCEDSNDILDIDDDQYSKILRFFFSILEIYVDSLYLYFKLVITFIMNYIYISCTLLYF